MSNITRAKNNLKQKLSFNDYMAPVSKYTGKPAHHNSAKSQNLKQPLPPRRQRIGKNYTQVGTPVSQFVDDGKIKATYYLAKEDNQALLDIFIKRLQEKNKTDKSALIAEAIHLLYKKEMK